MADLGTQDALDPLDPARHRIEDRQFARFSLDMPIEVRARGQRVLRGYTVDISEEGISAMFTLEIAVGAVVELTLEIAQEKISALAVVRQKCAFRYGFRFVDPDATRALIRRTCVGLTVCT
jgi:hypothetical protein